MNEKLTFDELTKAVAAATHWSKSLTHIFIKEMFTVIVEGLEKDGEVKIKGLGWFKLRWVEPRMGRNPQTGEPLLIPGYRKVLFRPEKSLRQLMNRRYAHLKPIFLKEAAPSEPTSLAEPLTEKPKPMASTISEADKEKSEKKQRLRWLAYALIPIFIILLWLLLKPSHQTPAETPSAASASMNDVVQTSDSNTGEATPAQSSQKHIVKLGDTLWDLAGDFYDENLFWPLIYRSNRPTLVDPDRLEPQQKLLLEPLEGSRLQLSGTDSARLGEGYHLVYLIYKEKNKPDAEAFQQVADKYVKKNIGCK